MQLKYKDKLSQGIETYKEIQSLLSNEPKESLILRTSLEYTNAYLEKLGKLSKLVTRLEKVNAELDQAEKLMHGFLIYMKDLKEGLYGNQIQTNRN